jgi:hypothetical protein
MYAFAPFYVHNLCAFTHLFQIMKGYFWQKELLGVGRIPSLLEFDMSHTFGYDHLFLYYDAM